MVDGHFTDREIGYDGTGWTTTYAVKADGQPNKLRIKRAGGHFTFYINDAELNLDPEVERVINEAQWDEDFGFLIRGKDEVTVEADYLHLKKIIPSK